MIAVSHDRRQLYLAAERHLDLALSCYYAKGQHSFWEEFAVTPVQAVAALKKRPQVFGDHDPALVGSRVVAAHTRMCWLAHELLAVLTANHQVPASLL